MDSMKKDQKKYDWSNEKILIADDDYYSFLLLQKVLSRTGASLIHAKNGKEALEKLIKNKAISIVILDIVMPYLNGFEIIKKCRTLLPDAIFVAFTADIIRYDKYRCQEAGFNICISKPVLPVKVLNILEEAMASRSQLFEEK